MERLIPSGDVTTRTVKSGVWNMSLTLSQRVLEVGSLVVLARLLDPAAFGVLGIALLTFSTLRGFSSLGIDSALIYNREENVDEYLNTAWVLQVLRGAVLAVVMFLAAPYIAGFFNEPRATDVLRGLSFTLPISGLASSGVVYFRKSLEFHKQFLFRISGSIADFVVAVSFALVFGNVWALVFGRLAADLTRTIVSYFMHPYRPSLDFDLDLAKDMYGYGKWLTVSTAVSLFLNRGDDALVGRVLTATALGYYQVAYRIAGVSTTSFTSTITSVVFSTYSKLQDDLTLLQEAFFRTMQIVSFVVFPIAIGIAAVAPSFVPAVLGPDWVPMVTALQLLAIYGLFASLSSVYHQLWMARGRPDYVTKTKFLTLVSIAVPIYPVTIEFGIAGTALVIAGGYLLVTLPVETYLTVKMIEVRVTRLLRELAYPAAASVAMGVAVVASATTLSAGSALVEFVVSVLVGVVAYVLLVLLLVRWSDWDIEQNVEIVTDALRG